MRVSSFHLRKISQAKIVYVSAVSAWEVAIKTAQGRLRLGQRFSYQLMKEAFAELPIKARHADAVLDLPLLHKDPFDRMLLAQARTEGLALVTADNKLSAYDVYLIPAR